MENKNKIEESLKRFKELISEDNLYGNLVNKGLLNEGGGVFTIVDDIIKQLKTKTNQTVLKDVLNQIEPNAKKLFSNRLNLPVMKSTDGFQKYILEELSKDLKKVLINSINQRNNIINNNETLKDAYVEIVDEYIKVFEKYSKDISNGHYTITSLQSKPKINSLLSLVDDGQGNTFYKRYEDLFEGGPTSSVLTDKLPPKVQKMYGDINKKMLPVRNFLQNLKLKKDLPFIEDFTTIYNRVRNRPNWYGKVWEALLVPFKMYTRNWWLTYGGLYLAKIFIVSGICELKDRMGSNTSVIENNLNLNNEIIIEAEETKDDFWLLMKIVKGIIWTLTTYGEYVLKSGVDPASVIPGFGLFDFRCGSVASKISEDLLSAFKDPEFLKREFKTKDGVMTGQELKNAVVKSLESFDITSASNAIDEIKADIENTYKQHLEGRLKN
jgi:hypothetical protein